MSKINSSSIGLLIICCIGFVFSGLSQNTSNYENVINSYLDTHKDEHNLTTNDIQDLHVNKSFLSKQSGINYVYLNQQYQGIRIYNAVSTVAVRDNSVFNYANAFVSNVAAKINATTPNITPFNAIQRTATHFDLGSTANISSLEVKERVHIFSEGTISKEKIQVELMYFLTEEDQLKLCWDLAIHTIDGEHMWSARVDAINGEMLDVYDWVTHCTFNKEHDHGKAHDSNHHKTDFMKSQTSLLGGGGSIYNVYAIPLESPDHGNRSIVSNPENLTASPFGWHDDNGVAGAEYTFTRGNNVWAQDDIDGNDGPGYSPDGTATLNFDFPLDLGQQPDTYLDAAITNLFYMNNIMHDVWYQYGFDEASGNFQQNNYGNGGQGNDLVFADAQDGSGTNNASFSSPPDGFFGRMNMFLWTSGVRQELVTINNGSVAGGYIAVNPATGAGNDIPGAPDTPLTADLAVVQDDDSNIDGNNPASMEPADGCDTITNGSDITGKIVLIRRGVCNFTVKIRKAQDAGAVGVIMVNHNNPDNSPTYTDYVNMAGSDPALNIPSVFVNFADGEALIAAVESGETLSATLLNIETLRRDGDLDNGVIAHEYGHGISIRLTGGAGNSGCLFNAEQMGEGWSDWFALMLSMTASEDFTVGRGIGTYASGQGINGVGIRPAKYSSDFAVNGFTYGDTNNTNLTQPHGIGFVWGTILWDLTEAYVNKYGFDPDFYNGTGGNNRIMQLIIESLKLQQCGVGFVTGRDAILAADTALFGGEDQCMIWEVFAKRGVGVNADQGNRFDRTDQVEDFSTPPDTDPSLANCTTLSTSDLVLHSINVYPNPTNDHLTISTTTNFGDVSLVLYDLNGRQIIKDTITLSDEFNVNISHLDKGVYFLHINGSEINYNTKIVKY